MKLYDLTKRLLEDKPQLRNSDKSLTWEVWSHLGFTGSTGITFTSFISPRCPSFDSISRARRKIQQLYPNLQASESVKKLRQKRQAEKGTFVYRQKVEKKGHWEYPNVLAKWIED